MTIVDVPTILALDFDGVVCDGLIEYFEASKRTYLEIWNLDSQELIDDIAPSFYRLRPVIEVGWEMPILLRALVLGVSPEKILQDWSSVVQSIIEPLELNYKDIAYKLDAQRDRYIESDLEGWLQLHKFYPGVIKRMLNILQSQTQLYIISTKEGRFIKALLEQQGIQLPEHSIIGKECKLPKHETLRKLIQTASDENCRLWFVEDRLNTLQTIQQQSDLKNVKLFLAAWGYNTQEMRESINHEPDIQLLSLDQFNQDFSAWQEKTL
jgi:phosphoglycolate phosphatase-like HAD superfamily hydrolase